MQFETSEELIEMLQLRKRIEELEAALAWGERLYNNYSLVGGPGPSIGDDNPGAWMKRVQELLQKPEPK